MKQNGKRREPLEKGAANVSKDSVAASKLANKRTQKDAIKRNKVKRSKGTVKDLDSTAQNSQ